MLADFPAKYSDRSVPRPEPGAALISPRVDPF
jgi:hypothetical protein